MQSGRGCRWGLCRTEIRTLCIALSAGVVFQHELVYRGHGMAGAQQRLRRIFRTKSTLMFYHTPLVQVIMLIKIMGLFAPGAAQDSTLHGIRDGHQPAAQAGE